MEEEMRKIEEEFAFQEKWIKIFKRGKFILQNIPELLILKIITKMEAKAFFNLLRTGKWMHLLCRENPDSLLISFEISIDDNNYMRKMPEVVKKERNQYIQQLRKIIRSKYYFFVVTFLWNGWYGKLMPLLEDLCSKEAYHFRRKCWNAEFFQINKFPINISIINHLQPISIEISMKQHGPLSENFNIPARTKSFFVKYASISDSDFYKEIERFGSLPLKVMFKREGHLELNKLFSILKGITQKKHLHHPLQFLTYKRESRTNYVISDSWPMDSFFPSSNFLPWDEYSLLFYYIIVAKSDVGVSAIHLYKQPGYQQLYRLQIMGIKSFNEWEEFTKWKIVDGDFNLEAGQTREQSDKQLAGVLEVFSAQVANKFFEGGKLVYPPLAPPEPAPELVEFLKEFEDFDIQPEKLAPHKPKWKKTEKLPDLPRKLPEIHSNNRLIEAKEVIRLRRFWMDFLQKGKFILELVPLKNVLDIARRIEHTRFALLFSSTKWVNELIQKSASNFRIHGGSPRFSRFSICMKSSDFKEALKSLEFYYLNCIQFDSFDFDADYLKKVLKWVRERKIFVKQILLGDNCPLIQELFESFARGPESLVVSQYVILPAPIKFSPQLKEIGVNLDFFEGDEFKELFEGFTGIEQAVIWLCTDDEVTNNIITHQLEILKSKKCRSNILIRSQDAFHPCIYDPQFDLSQISETVFIFRSMARGRGGVWNYFIRLEKAGFGAVGIALFADSLHVIEGSEEDDCFNQFDIHCEYFPTMENFLDYFEKEVGSKRQARDWMQLEEKDETIEPREKDFNNYKIQKPYIHFNEQKEADDLKEVRRRFFS